MMEGRMSVYCPLRDSFKGPVCSSFDSYYFCDSSPFILFGQQYFLFVNFCFTFYCLFLALNWEEIKRSQHSIYFSSAPE